MSAKKFTGSLNEPFEPILLGLITEQEARSQRQPLLNEKLALILKHYGIAERDSEYQMEALAHCLLRDFVPGFQVADPNKGVGRKQVWNVVRLSFLVCEMRRCISQTTIPRTELAAARILAKKDPWKTICAMTSHEKQGDGEDERAETLRRLYTTAKGKTPDFASRKYERQKAGRPLNKFDSYDSMLKSLIRDNFRVPFV
jgi:hypothetical protein